MTIFMLLLGVFMSNAATSIYDQSITTIEGKKTTLGEYKGKPLLVVNIATQCGYTPQLTGLEKLYQKYKAKGLVVVGIPSNEFGGQTPEKDADVKTFCKTHHGVTFPLMSKANVLGEKKSPVVKWLLEQGPSQKEIGWNFEKFLVTADGKVAARFESSVKPDSPEMTSAIEGTLKK
jgi:glutathione peroxidase